MLSTLRSNPRLDPFRCLSLALSFRQYPISNGVFGNHLRKSLYAWDTLAHERIGKVQGDSTTAHSSFPAQDCERENIFACSDLPQSTRLLSRCNSTDKFPACPSAIYAQITSRHHHSIACAPIYLIDFWNGTTRGALLRFGCVRTSAPPAKLPHFAAYALLLDLLSRGKTPRIAATNTVLSPCRDTARKTLDLLVLSRVLNDLD